METIDVSKNITKEYKPGTSDPSYRKGRNGLCIQSTCKNRNYEAYNDRIFFPIGYVENWNLLMASRRSSCMPMLQRNGKTRKLLVS